MTPTGKPDDDHEAERPESERPAPPPPRWLDEQEPPAGPLLPEGGGPVQEGPRQDPSEPVVGDVEDDASDDDSNTGANDDAAAMADRTIME
ncbi:hypothetical protein G3I24_43325, partial [Micromonospora aurantiaca]|nr:hypothetical protein [Micromonospora aurantiaca]